MQLFKKREEKAGTFAPSPELIAEAKTQPNGWVYEIKGNFGPDDRVPPEAIKGAYKVGPDGKLTGEYKPNPNYRGSL